MKMITSRTSLVLIMISAVLILSLPIRALSAQIWSISIKNIQLDRDERIVGFELKVTSGGICSLKSIPMGWNIQIDNDASWNTNMKGEIEVGSAALNQDFFKDFAVIKKAPQEDPPFDVEMVLITTRDFEKEKRYSLKKEKFIFRSLSGPSNGRKE